jgi:hypothetical protein
MALKVVDKPIMTITEHGERNGLQNPQMRKV